MKQDLALIFTYRDLLFTDTQFIRTCKWCGENVTGNHQPCCDKLECVKDQETYLRFLNYALVGYNTSILRADELNSLLIYLDRCFMESRSKRGKEVITGGIISKMGTS